MSSFKPVRIIDVSKNLKLATSTIISFLKKNCYPVDRSYHTPLLPEIVDKIADEYGAGTSSTFMQNMAEASKRWEADHSLAAERIRHTYRQVLERSKLKRERARRVHEGRERARTIKQELLRRKAQINALMQSVCEPTDMHDGDISTCHLDLEIIKLALAMVLKEKASLLNYLRNIKTSAI